MAYKVNLAIRAARDLALIFDEINAEHSDAALNWYFGLRDAIRSLGKTPQRCSKTPEDGRFRHLLYGRKPNVYRVIYLVSEKRRLVEVLHIRHGARNRFNVADLI